MTTLPPMCHYLICKALFDICLDNCSKDVKSLRLQAVMSVPAYLQTYISQDFMEEIIEGVCRKKTQYILQASTQREIEEIMKPQMPKWRAGEIVCESPYFIAEEELMLWSMISPYTKLTSGAVQRCANLFKQVFGY